MSGLGVERRLNSVEQWSEISDTMIMTQIQPVRETSSSMYGWGAQACQ